MMVTGDHPTTAASIARALDLDPDRVHARVTPVDKLRLVESLQRDGHVVAVTGDGINDAPALRRADVGVAMGRSGTEAARQAAEVVLTDDDFATIVAAVREGRIIGDNVRKFVAFLLSANFGEIVLFAIAVLAGLGAPMTVVQVLTVNLLTDGLPAIALTRDPASPATMLRPPTPLGRLFTPRPVCHARRGRDRHRARRHGRVRRRPRARARRGSDHGVRDGRARRARVRVLDPLAVASRLARAPQPAARAQRRSRRQRWC